MPYNNYYNPNQPMINQLMRQRDNVENLLNQYLSSIPQQNLYNTNIIDNGFEARILTDNEQIETTLVNKRTMFLDKKNRRLAIKELDGKISEEYEIIIPLDEKDKKILELENKIKDMEEIINVKLSKPIESDGKLEQSVSNDNVSSKSSTKTNHKSVPISE